jgi:hypothetical protein
MSVLEGFKSKAFDLGLAGEGIQLAMARLVGCIHRLEQRDAQRLLWIHQEDLRAAYAEGRELLQAVREGRLAPPQLVEEIPAEVSICGRCRRGYVAYIQRWRFADRTYVRIAQRYCECPDRRPALERLAGFQQRSGQERSE